MNKGFTKEHTQAIKGVAVMLLLCHHLFFATTEYVNYLMYYTYTEEYNITVILAQYAKMCVAMFIMLSAYGLTLSYERWRKEGKSAASFSLDRYLALLSGFVVIAVLGIIAGLFLDRSFSVLYGEGLSGGLYLLLDILGLADLFHTPTANGTWWYMSFAAMQVALFPMLYAGVKKFRALSLFAFLGLFLLGIYHYMVIYFFSSVLGIWLALTRGFDKARQWQPLAGKVAGKLLKFVLYALAFGVAVLLCEGLPEAVDLGEGPQATHFRLWGLGLLALVLSGFLYEFVLPLKPLRAVLGFLGKHSANIFMMHTFFYAYFFPEFYYGFEEPEYIFGMLLITTLAASVAVELLKSLLRYPKGVEKLRGQVSRRLNPPADVP